MSDKKSDFDFVKVSLTPSLCDMWAFGFEFFKFNCKFAIFHVSCALVQLFS